MNRHLLVSALAVVVAGSVLLAAAALWPARPVAPGAVASAAIPGKAAFDAAAAPAPHRDPPVFAYLRLSPEQWASIDIRPVGTAPFATLLVADAVVAFDDDATVPVFSPTSGQVLAVRAQVGQAVAKGQALALVAGTEAAQAQSDLAAATAQARTAHALLDLDRAATTRQSGLLDAGGGAAKDWLQSQSDLVGAEGNAQSADAALAAARVKARATGAATSARAGTGGSAADAGGTRLLAPIAGEVVQKQVAPGQFIASVAAGAASPLFTVSDLRRLWVLAGISEEDARNVHVGQSAEVATLADAGAPLRARVAWIAPALDPVSRRLQVRLEVANERLALRPQMTARVRLLDTRAPAALAIPSAAVIFDGEQAHCFVVSAERTVIARRLQLGRSEAGFTEVVSGLKAGESVVVRGALFVDTMAAGNAS